MFLLSTASRVALRSTHLPTQWVWWEVLSVSKGEADYSPLPDAEVKNVRDCMSSHSCAFMGGA
jgi:hypothetical protein